MNIPKHLEKYHPEYDESQYEYCHGLESNNWGHCEYWMESSQQWHPTTECRGPFIHRRPIAQYQYIPAKQAKTGDELLDPGSLYMEQKQIWHKLGIAFYSLHDSAVVRRRVQP